MRSRMIEAAAKASQVARFIAQALREGQGRKQAPPSRRRQAAKVASLDRDPTPHDYSAPRIRGFPRHERGSTDMSDTVIVILRLIHIVIGTFWVGGAITTAFFVLPTVK